MIVLIAKATIQPDKLEQFLDAVKIATEASLKEEGVTRYELVQSVDEDNTFLLIEEYADEASFASHGDAEHTKTLGATLGTMIAGPPEIKRYSVTNVEML